jgi:hypothetical protein
MFNTMVKKQKEIEDLKRLNKDLLSALKGADVGQLFEAIDKAEKYMDTNYN